MVLIAGAAIAICVVVDVSLKNTQLQDAKSAFRVEFSGQLQRCVGDPTGNSLSVLCALYD